MSGEFFIHLPSNACPSIYPLNTASDYTIQLNEPIYLENGKWSVSLNDISYTSELKTIGHESIHCTTPELKTKFANRIRMHGGDYHWQWAFHDITDMVSGIVDETNKGEVLCKLCAKMTEICSPEFILFGFYRRERNHTYWTDVLLSDSVIDFEAYDYKVQIDIRKPNIFLQLTDQLVSLLGFRERKTFYHQQAFITYLDSTKPIEKMQLTMIGFIMDELHPFLRRERFVVKHAGDTIQQLIDNWQKLNIGCQLTITDGRLSITKSTNKIICLDTGLLSSLHLLDEVLCYPTAYSNPDADPLNVHDKDENEGAVTVYDTAITVSDDWIQFNHICIDLPPRIYESASELILDLNNKFKLQAIRKIRLVLANQKVKIKIGRHYSMQIESRLQEILGFKTATSFSSGTFISDRPINLAQPRVRTMSVYTNIIDYVHVGSRMEQLLRRFVHEDDVKTRIVMKEFLHNIYIPVRESSISCISISICDEHLEHVPFHDGKTMVTLHFKRI